MNISRKDTKFTKKNLGCLCLCGKIRYQLFIS